MSFIVNIDCFKGFHNLSQNCFNAIDLQCFIDIEEEYYLNKLFGCELKDLFLGDFIGGVPQTQIYVDLFEKFCIDSECCGCSKKCECNYQSKGLKYLLTGLIYSQWVLQDQTVNSMSGTKVFQEGNVINLGFSNLQRVSDMRWNDAVESYKAVQEYITRNKEDYPTYKGCDLKYSFLDVL